MQNLLIHRATLTVFSLLHLIYAGRTCYTPNGVDRNNGSSDPLYNPCNNNVVAMCCSNNGGGDTCGDNIGFMGLCYNGASNIYWRESCTDPTWKDPGCIKLFVNGTGINGTQVTVQPDGSNTTDVELTRCDDGSWCYGTNNFYCCAQHQGLFINYTTGETTTTNPNPSTSSSPVSTSSSSSSGVSTGAAAGIGVGVGLGCAIIFFALGCFLASMRRKRRDQRTPQELGNTTSSHPHTDNKHGGGGYQRAPHGEMDGAPHSPRYELSGNANPDVNKDGVNR